MKKYHIFIENDEEVYTPLVLPAVYPAKRMQSQRHPLIVKSAATALKEVQLTCYHAEVVKLFIGGL